MKKITKITVTFVVFYVLGIVLFAKSASAYIDPSAATYMIQLIVGIVIASGAALGFYFKKIKRKFSKNKENLTDYDTVEEVHFDNDDEFNIEQYEKE